MKKKDFLRMAAYACAAMGLVACTDYQAMQTRATSEDKHVMFTTSVTDALGSSEATINITSSVTYEDGSSEDFNPIAYLRVELAQTHIEVSDASQMGVTLVGEEITSPEDDASDGKVDVVKQFTFSDGQVATVYYGWQFERKELADGILNAPHVEISAVNYSDYTSEDVTEESATITLVFQAKLTGADATYAPQETVELKPRYTKAVTATEPEPEDPTYRLYVEWEDWAPHELGFRIYAYKTVGGEETLMQENGEFFHLYLSDFGPSSLHAADADKVGEITYEWYSGLTENEDPFTRGYFTASPTRYQYWYVPSYLFDGERCMFSSNFSTQVLEFKDGDYTAKVEVGVVPEMTSTIEVLSERAGNVPEGTTYVATDVQHLVVTNYVRAVSDVEVTTNKNEAVVFDKEHYIDLYE